MRAAAQCVIIGGAAVGVGLLYHLAHEEIYQGRYTSPEEQVARIEAVTPALVREAARRFLDPAAFALTALGPAAGKPLAAGDWPGTA